MALVPPFTASTELARGLLPDTVPHRDAAFTAGRAALLVTALTGSPEHLFAATEDRLHQHYRATAMPQSAALVAQLRSAGHAAVISGAGPTVLVLARGDVEGEAVSVGGTGRMDGPPPRRRTRCPAPSRYRIVIFVDYRSATGTRRESPVLLLLK